MSNNRTDIILLTNYYWLTAEDGTSMAHVFCRLIDKLSSVRCNMNTASDLLLSLFDLTFTVGGETEASLRGLWDHMRLPPAAVSATTSEPDLLPPTHPTWNRPLLSMSNVTIWKYQKEIVLRCYRENTIAYGIVGFFGRRSSSVNLKFQNFDQFSQSDQALHSWENFTILTISAEERQEKKERRGLRHNRNCSNLFGKSNWGGQNIHTTFIG